MVAGWAVVLSALVYLCFLFAVAHWGDRSGRGLMQGPAARAEPRRRAFCGEERPRPCPLPPPGRLR